VLGAEEAVLDAAARFLVARLAVIARQECRMDDLALNVTEPFLVVIFHRGVDRRASLSFSFVVIEELGCEVFVLLGQLNVVGFYVCVDSGWICMYGVGDLCGVALEDEEGAFAN